MSVISSVDIAGFDEKQTKNPLTKQPKSPIILLIEMNMGLWRSWERA